MAYATRVQMQLMLAIAYLYGCPFQRDDEEDLWTVFNAALGLKGIERVGTYGRYAMTEVVRREFRRILRAGARRAIQRWIIKVAGPRVGKYFAEKYVMRLIPVLNAGIGYVFNNRVTKSVGKWAKIKAKLRASAFKPIALITAEAHEAVVWVPALVFYVGTAGGELTENLLALYSQASKRLRLSDAQVHLVEELTNSEELPHLLAEGLPKICPEGVRRALYDVALVAAVVNLDPKHEYEESIAQVATWLNVAHNSSALKEKIRYLQR